MRFANRFQLSHEWPGKMSEAQRQHPVAAITKVLEIVKQNFFTILIVLFLGSGGSSMFEFFGLIPVLLFLLIAGVLEWWRFTYQIVDGELHIKQGVFVRKNLYLSPERIQVIDISAGVIQRLFSLVSVEVKTAGSSSKAAKIDAVSRSEAERIKAILPKGEKAESTAEDEENTAAKVYKLRTKDLLIAAGTSGNLTVTLTIIAGAASQLDQLNRFITEEQVINFFQSAVPASLAVNLVVIVVIFALVLSWILSFAGTIIKNYGFTLQIDEEELHIESGLFEQKQSTVPFNRIQGIRIKEELLRQPFGYTSIMLESAGYGDQQNNAATLFPLLRSSNIASFLSEVVPDYNVKVDGVSPPKKALRRYMLRMAWLSMVIILPVWWWVPYGVYGWSLLIPALYLGFMQYKDALIGTSGKTMVIRSRSLSKTTAIVKKRRIQAANSSQNLFQRRLGLFSYAVTVASGIRGRTFTIRELDEPRDSHFLDWVSPDWKRPDCQSPETAES